MKYYLGHLCYCPDADHGVPDEVTETILIQSDDDLTEVKPYLLNEYYEIKELLEQYDCERLNLEEIDEEEYKEEWEQDIQEEKVISLFINKSML